MTATLLEIGELARTRPAIDASPTVVAEWLERKAVMLRHVASDAWLPSDRDTYQQGAKRAHDQAVRLLAGIGGSGGGSR